MAYFLLKTEPGTYSFADLQKEGRTAWDGVRNNLALKHIKSAKVGDQVVIYHTGKERQAVGIAEIVKAPYPDPGDPKLTLFDVEAKKALSEPVGLDAIKESAAFSNSPLLRMGRLSVVPLTAAQWKVLLKLGGLG